MSHCSAVNSGRFLIAQGKRYINQMKKKGIFLKRIDYTEFKMALILRK
jgi:hypothetical protein